MTIQASVLDGKSSLNPLVKSLTKAGFILVHNTNCSFHWVTLALLIHIIIVDLLIVEAAVTPVKDFPAPHGKTIIPKIEKESLLVN